MTSRWFSFPWIAALSATSVLCVALTAAGEQDGVSTAPGAASLDARRDMITTLPAPRPHPSLGGEAQAFDRLVGTWDCDYSFHAEDGTVQPRLRRAQVRLDHRRLRTAGHLDHLSEGARGGAPHRHFSAFLRRQDEAVASRVRAACPRHPYDRRGPCRGRPDRPCRPGQRRFAASLVVQRHPG